MRIVLITLFLGLISCSTFNSSERLLFEKCYANLSSVAELKELENENHIKWFRQFNYMSGYNYEDIDSLIESTILQMNRIEFGDTIIIQSKEFRWLLKKCYMDDVKSPENILGYQPLDTLFFKSWKADLKEDFIHHIFSMIGCNSYLASIKPFIETKKKEIHKGEPYLVSFYLGNDLRNVKVEGPGVKGNSLFYIPDSTSGENKWKGKLIHFRDTIDIEIPYEIVDCP